MSTVHQSPYWSEIKSNFNSSWLVDAGNASQNGVAILTYSAKMRAAGFAMYLLEQMSQHTLESACQTIRPFSHIPMMREINFTDLLAQAAVNLRTTYSTTAFSAHFLVREMEQRTGLNYAEQKAIFDRTYESLEKFLQTFGSQFLSSDFARLKEEWQEGGTAFKVQHRVSLGAQIFQPQLELTPEQCLFLKIKRTSDLPKINSLDCAGYAFLTLKEERAITWIKTSSTDERFMKPDFLRALCSWNYRNVSNPDAGDLVVYINEGQGVPKATHYGVFLESGLVRSKMGITESCITDHQLADVPAQFGNKIAFYRKTTLSAK